MFQHIVNVLYRYPKARLKTFRRFGGYLNYRKMIRCSDRMKEASLHLPPVQSYPDGLRIYFLTGEKYLYQTLYCIQSLVKCSNERFKFILVDDGSFTAPLTARIAKQLPGAQIVNQDAILQNLQSILPETRFPTLHHKRKVYPHIKKLTDVHSIPDDAWKLVLDSDMLFWKEPAEIIAWLKNPDKPMHMIDCADSYGYSAELMEQLCGVNITPRVNVGAIGLNSSHINWNNIESWINTLEEAEGKTYYLEQALSAMLIGNMEAVVLNKDEYIVNPAKNCRGVLHHYVDLSKELYFTEEWQRV